MQVDGPLADGILTRAIAAIKTNASFSAYVAA
jgi:hypothetical protein